MILVVDDDPTIRASLGMLLRRGGYEPVVADGPAAAMEIVRSREPELVLLDMNFSRFTTGEEGLTLLRQIKIFAPKVPVILMTAWGSIELAVEGMRAGAFDFITKPWDNRRLLDRVAVALDMVKETPVNPPAANPTFDRSFIIGNSQGLRAVLATVARVAPTNAPVLITGESGTGKELIAEAIHRNSRRHAGPFVKVNLGGLSQSLFESEMFGHKKGAFTDAIADRVGRFEAADGGTIFLDEIGELDMACQVKLLRVLQEQRFEPLGSSKTRQVDVRIVCATNADLPAMVAARTFREDLFYRINLVNVELPPLRMRKDDVPLLAEKFLTDAAHANSLDVPALGPDAVTFLKSLPYPGNIRELKNLVERTLLICGGATLTEADFRRSGANVAAGDVAPAAGTLDEVERERIVASMERHGGNVSRVAAELGLSRGALYRRLEKFNLKS
ncbi:MAG: sigma-54-dependent Fis family transcriptional regulator [Muribaculaceae bacterium]|nr:sigma-54-dependent Fis family transcriptional regulator [Muribaculaceae bacterium]MCI9054793.1 sigma-54-dependent Fis family transcriptional regulator [Muribaculaceae bacterium]